MADGKMSAASRRDQQLKRWDDSETNRESDDPRPVSTSVRFQDGCVFLAACSSGDRDEVGELLERGADINTANVDGLTALHQACIDDDIHMVEFLIEKGADVDVRDNEGWTPLHATASCGFTDIARYLLQHGADVAAVNNDADLPIDISDENDMTNLLQEEMDEKGVDAEAARREEENMMMVDANKWLRNKNVEDNVHPKTGATAVHVAAAKGYIRVLNLLLQAGANINAQDYDGWTPLHAAVHWGQEESCKLLVENLCDMDVKNYAGHTVFDLADSDMLPVLEELKEKQVVLRSASESDNILHTQGLGSRRRSSISRRSSDQKHVFAKGSEEERAAVEANLSHSRTSESEVINTSSTEDAETEGRNEANKRSSLILQPQLPRNRPSSFVSSLHPHKHDVTKIDESLEQDKPDASIIPPPPTPSTPPVFYPEPEASSSLSRTSRQSLVKTQDDTAKPSAKDLMSRSLSVPARLPRKGEDVSKTRPRSMDTEENPAQSWRRGLLKINSTGRVHEAMNENEDGSLPRSASSPRIVLDNRIESLQDRVNLRRPLSSLSGLSRTSSSSSTSSTDPERYSWSGSQSSYIPYRSYLTRPGLRNTFMRQDLNQQKEQESDTLGDSRSNRPASTISALSSTSSPDPLTTTASTTTTTVVTTTSGSTATSSVFRRSYEPPKRDEETETQRKARAKHARQTRRPTQGVSLEDIEKAEEVLRQGEPSKKNPSEDPTSSSRTSIRDATQYSTLNAAPSSSLESSIPTSDKNQSSSLSIKDSPRDDTSSYQRRSYEDRQNGESSTRTSYRRQRGERDPALFNGGSTTLDTTSSYVPRSQRNALSTSDVSSSTLNNIPSLSRSTSLRSRLRNGETESTPEEKKEEPSETKKSSSTEVVEKKETAASRARRKRNERRPTGKVIYNPDDLEKSKENQDEDESKEDSENASRLGRYSSSDVPSDSSTRSRPISYSEHSRSTTHLDEYKKRYEDEKHENGKLRKELDQCKKDLLEAKAELDKVMKQGDSSSSRSTDSSDKREKRALERKVSEYEEELKKMEAIRIDNKRLKEENGALIRVISKLSK